MRWEKLYYTLLVKSDEYNSNIKIELHRERFIINITRDFVGLRETDDTHYMD